MPGLSWSLPYGVRVVMSSAGDGDLRDPGRRAGWCADRRLPPPAVLRQEHGVRIVAAAAGTPQSDAGDGLVASNGAIAVFGADCPPLAIAAPDALVVAHCGWRGTAAGMVASAAAALAASTASPPGSWAALVGPGVHPDDYEVDQAVLAARTWPVGCLRSGRPGHAWLDLPAAIAADCLAAGIGQVGRSPLSTSRDPRLRSHRRHGAGFPQMLAAWREAACAG